MVPVGNAFNAADTTGNPNPAGAVGYAYSIGKYEVTNGGASPYGAFDLGGNVWEWNEQIIFGVRGLRGGSWNFGDFVLQSSFRSFSGPSFGGDFDGFRVAGP